MKRGLPLVLAIALLSVSAFAQGDIKTVIKAVEGHYAVRHHGVPGLWIAKPFMLGSGVGGLKMAVFENFSHDDNGGTFEGVVKQALGPEWSPFVSAVSKHERTVIYVRPNGSKLAMLIATFEDDGLTLMQMKLSGKALRHWVDEPVRAAAEHDVGANGKRKTSTPATAALVSKQ